MPKVIRKLTKKIWMDREMAEELGGLQADALKNFQTADNALSLFYVDEATTAERIASVIALGRQSIDNVDFVVFDCEILDRFDIQFRPNSGDTVDQVVNAKHLDVFNMTASKICTLAEQVQLHGEFGRLTKKQVLKSLKEIDDNGGLDRSRIDLKHLEQIAQCSFGSFVDRGGSGAS